MLKDPGNAKDFIGQTSSPNSQIGGGTFTVTVTDDTVNRVVNIVSTGEYKGIHQTAKIRVIRSISGIGGIFKHAIVARNNVNVENASGTGISIDGSVASKDGTINLGTHGTASGGKILDPSLIFPPIITPPNRTPAVAYNETYPIINSEKTISSTSTAPKYVSVGSINIKNCEINITGNGIVHMYVDGNIKLDTNSRFDVASTAKLYVYVIGNRNITLIGNGNQNNIFLYAPDSDISWNNAQPSNDFFGAIIGKTVTLHNQLSIRYNPDMVNDVDLDTTGVGVTFTGYTWID